MIKINTNRHKKKLSHVPVRRNELFPSIDRFVMDRGQTLSDAQTNCACNINPLFYNQLGECRQEPDEKMIAEQLKKKL